MRLRRMERCGLGRIGQTCWMLALALFAALPGRVGASTSSGVAAEAEGGGNALPRIVMVLWRGETPVEAGFRAGLTDEGVAARIEILDIARDRSRLPGFIAALRDDPPALIYSWGTSATLAVAGRFGEPSPVPGVPKVFVMVSAPWATGIAAPVDGPGRDDVTGVSHIAPIAAQISAIMAYRPLQRLGVIYNPQEANSVSNAEALRVQAAERGFVLDEVPLPVRADGQPSPDDIAPAVAGLAERGAEVIYIGPDNFVGNYREQLTDAAMAHGIPCFTATELEIRDGDAMFGLVSRYELVGRLAARKAAAILRDGVTPSQIPVETLERFAYLIRWPVVEQLGRYPPLGLLRYAEIIE